MDVDNYNHIFEGNIALRRIIKLPDDIYLVVWESNAREYGFTHKNLEHCFSIINKEER